MARIPKQAAKQHKVKVKRDVLPHARDAAANAQPAAPFPAFPSDIEDVQNSLLTWCAAVSLLPPRPRCSAGTARTSATYLGGGRAVAMRRMAYGCLRSCCSKREWRQLLSTGTAG
jgi:hypothetical protein